MKTIIKKTGYSLALVAATSLFVAPLAGTLTAIIFSCAIMALALAAACIVLVD